LLIDLERPGNEHRLGRLVWRANALKRHLDARDSCRSCTSQVIWASQDGAARCVTPDADNRALALRQAAVQCGW
jgi:hypothetical protein